MITKNLEDNYTEYSQEGHAKEAVCSAISAVSQAVINSLLENVKVDLLLREEAGTTKIKVLEKDASNKEVQLLMKTLVEFTHGLQEVHPKHMMIISRIKGE